MLSTEPRPVMPKRRENVLGPTRYTIPCMSLRINATAPVLLTRHGQLPAANSGYIFLQSGQPQRSREIPVSIVDAYSETTGDDNLG
jgi:hypothetical protein